MSMESSAVSSDVEILSPIQSITHSADFYWSLVDFDLTTFSTDASSSSSTTENSFDHVELEDLMFENVDFDRFPRNFVITINNMFPEKEYMKKIMKFVAIKNSFQFRVDRSSATRYKLVCVKPSCEWQFVALSLPKSKELVVKKYISKHTCPRGVGSNTHKQASIEIISDCIKSDFFSGCPDRRTAKDIVDYMKNKFHVDISYFKTWKARDLTLKQIRGSHEESYSYLPYLGRLMQERNPGTFTAYEIQPVGKFLYFFIAFGASISGWQHCRPVISVDGTFLTGKHRGTLLLAAALDSDNHIFPVSFAIVNSENDGSWKWFFEKMKEAFGECDDFVVVSDQKSNIRIALVAVFDEAKHAMCMQHIHSNLKTLFHKPQIGFYFRKCAEAYTTKEYEYYLKRLEAINPEIPVYLTQANPKSWARSQFPGKWYNIMTTNIAECMNAVLLSARTWPICYMVLGIRKLLQDWFYKHKKSIESMKVSLTNWSYEILFNHEQDAGSMKVRPINDNDYEVLDGAISELVDVPNRQCSCCYWQTEDFPCSHTIAVLWRKDLNPLHYISHYYTKDTFEATYASSVYPLEEMSRWTVPQEELESISCPNVKASAGRPKKKRVRTAAEILPSRCRNCGKIGHNKRSCKAT